MRGAYTRFRSCGLEIRISSLMIRNAAAVPQVVTRAARSAETPARTTGGDDHHHHLGSICNNYVSQRHGRACWTDAAVSHRPLRLRCAEDTSRSCARHAADDLLLLGRLKTANNRTEKTSTASEAPPRAAPAVQH